MLDSLAVIERLPLVDALKVSFYVYPLVNALHILAIGALVTAVILMDLRILGLVASVPRAPFLRLMRRVIAVALAAAVLTGLALFSIRAQEYATQPVFQIKMVLLALAGVNFWAFHQLPLPSGEAAAYPPMARALAVLSILLWLSVLTAGRFIGFL